MQRVKNIIHLLQALMAVLYYRFPARKMKVIAITGTDGKTTTTHLIYHILHSAGLPVSYISSVEAKIGDEKQDTGFHVTTPSPFQLQKLIFKAKQSGSRYLVLEVTSHALDQFRVLGASIDIALVTNISHEHIDYHKTIENYRRTKAKIFEGSSLAVLNRDDASFNYFSQKVKSKIISFSLREKNSPRSRIYPENKHLPGNFNKYNILAAVSVAEFLKIDKKIIKQAIATFSGVPGRMEEVKNNRKFTIIIDFAHKLNALQNVLITARENTKNKIIAVFGSAGLRDRIKRPLMGEIAAQLADYIVLTAEDPRTEDVRDIIEQIAKGCLKKNVIDMGKNTRDLKTLNNNRKYFWKIADRQEAINFAIRKLAQEGDTVLLLGKGHERSMCYGRTEYKWNEKNAVEKALYGKVKNTLKV